MSCNSTAGVPARAAVVVKVVEEHVEDVVGERVQRIGLVHRVDVVVGIRVDVALVAPVLIPRLDLR